MKGMRETWAEGASDQVQHERYGGCLDDEDTLRMVSRDRSHDGIP